jgi:hypothetical protein
MKDYKEIFLAEKLKKVAQDADIGDKEGTQPKKYYAGDMSKATKEKRASHFKNKKSGPAPGDTGAKTKLSKHTIKYNKMYGEVVSSNQQELGEGINDPSIFKAVFLAGGPGSGKSFIVGQTGLISLGMKLVNSDPAFEKALKKAGLTTTADDIFSVRGQEVRGHATKLTDVQKAMYIRGRLGLVIDGTGKDVKKILTQKKFLEELGYDCAMIFVNTDLSTALNRNRSRERVLPDDQVEKMWKDVQKNIGRFQNTFKSQFYVVDNSSGADFQRDSKRTYKNIKSWSARPPRNSISQKWISQEKKKRGIKEDYSMNLYEDSASSMALAQLRAISDKSEQISDELLELSRKASTQDAELEAWVQSKITKASDYISSVYDYMLYSERDE